MYLLHGKLINFTRNPYLGITGQFYLLYYLYCKQRPPRFTWITAHLTLYLLGNIIEISKYCEGGDNNYGGL